MNYGFILVVGVFVGLMLSVLAADLREHDFQTDRTSMLIYIDEHGSVLRVGDLTASQCKFARGVTLVSGHTISAECFN